MTADSTTDVEVGIACDAIVWWCSGMVAEFGVSEVFKEDVKRLKCLKLWRICLQVGCALT